MEIDYDNKKFAKDKRLIILFWLNTFYLSNNTKMYEKTNNLFLYFESKYTIWRVRYLNKAFSVSFFSLLDVYYTLVLQL